MDPMEIELKFKKSQGRHLCYSKQCPDVIGAGDSEDEAASQFWLEFDRFCERLESQNQKAI